MESTIAGWGPAAVLLGSALEGGASVICGGLLAQKHLFPLPLVIFAAALGSFARDEILFFVGRHFRHQRRVRALLQRPLARRALMMGERYPTAFVIAFHFVYGFRLLSPLAIGVSRLGYRRFTFLNGIASLLWAAVFTSIGYFLGGLTHAIFSPGPRALAWIGACVIVAAVVLSIRAFFRDVRHDRRAMAPRIFSKHGRRAGVAGRGIA